MGLCCYDEETVILQCNKCGKVEEPVPKGSFSDMLCLRNGDEHECSSCLLKRHAQGEGPSVDTEDLPF